MTDPHDSGWLSAPEAAAVMGITRQSVCRLVRAGVLEAARGPRRSWRIDPGLVHRYAAWRSLAPTRGAA